MMKTKSRHSLAFIGTAMGALLFAVGLVGCGPDSLTLRAATTPTPAAAVNGSSGAARVAVAGPAPVVQAQPAPITAVGVPSAAPARVSAAIVSQPPVASSAPRGIQVTGNGEIEARPDEAIVEVGVQTRAATAQEAQATNNTTMQSVLNAIKALNIPDKDIRTTGVSLYPIIDRNNTVSGYNASNNVMVTVENIDQTGTVLDAAVKAGANTSTSVQFTFKDQTGLRNQALAAAAADAKSKAQALASALGLQVTGVESVTEGQVVIPRPFAASAATASAAAPSVPIEPGQQAVTAQVTIVFGY